MDMCPYLPIMWVDCLKIQQLYYKENLVFTLYKPCRRSPKCMKIINLKKILSQFII